MVTPPKDFEFYRSLETIVTSGTNDIWMQLLQHANSLEDVKQMTHHTMLVPTKEAFLNLGVEACQALQSDDGRVHLAAILRHNMFAHKLLVQVSGQSLLVDELDRGAVVDLCSLDDGADPFRCLIDAKSHLTISDGYSVANVEMDAYFLGSNVIYILLTLFCCLHRWRDFSELV